MPTVAPKNSIGDIFGQVTPPPGSLAGDPFVGLSRIFSVIVMTAIMVGSVIMLIYLFWGAFQWITSEGEKDAIAAARKKMTAAVLGMLMIFVAMMIFGVVTGDILGIIRKDAQGDWIFRIPTVNPL